MIRTFGKPRPTRTLAAVTTLAIAATFVPLTAGVASAATAAPARVVTTASHGAKPWTKTDAASSIVFSGGPGTDAPPPTLGPYVMQAFPTDTQPIGGVTSVAGPTGTLGFDQALTHLQIGNGWATWSNNYGGDVYQAGSTTITLALPPSTSAFYFYAEPNQFSTFTISATNGDGTSSGDVDVNGSAGASYFGFYSTDATSLSSITVTTSDPQGFAIGEFGVAEKPAVPVFTRAAPSLVALAGAAYSASFAASGQAHYALTGAPAWLSVDAGGAVVGTPPAGTGSFSYGVKAFNSLGTANTGPYTVTVAAAAAVKGTVVGQGTGANPVGGATVQACANGTSLCQRTTTPADGTFSIPAPVGSSVVLTAYPPQGSGGVATTTNPIPVPAGGVQGQTIALDGITPLPVGLQVNGSISPTLFWGSPSDVAFSGCADGSVFVTVEGENTQTGLRQVDLYPLTETPAGSGDYAGTIPAEYPVHGPTSISDQVFCPSDTQSAVLPFLGAAGDTVLISGSGFTGATAVAFGKTPATSFTVQSDTVVQAVVPAGSGDATVTVTTPSGPGTLAGPAVFSYFAVSGVSPASGPAAGGTPVTLTGAGFTRANSVTFGATEAVSFQILSDTQIQAVAPAGTGTVDVGVTEAGTGDTATATGAFTYTAGGSAAKAASTAAAKPAVAKPTTAGPAAHPATAPHAGPAAQSGGFDIGAMASKLVAAMGDQIRQAAQNAANSAAAAVPASALCNSTFSKNHFKEEIHAALSAGAGSAAIAVLMAIARANAPLVIGGAMLLLVEAPWAIVALVGLWGLVSYEISVEFNAMLDTYLDPLLDNAISQKCDGKRPEPPMPNPTAYIDPSGTVLDGNGNPVADATVTLLRADTAAGPFTALDPAGPGIQPAVNPQTTDADGVFHWDVFAGWYEIQASAPGCTDPASGQSAATIGPYPVPPPQVGLILTLACAGQAPPPTPAVTGLSARTGPAAGGTTVDVFGTDFTPASTVAFGTKAAAAVTFLSTGELAVTSPAGNGSVDVTVHNGSAVSAKTDADKFFLGSVPVVTSLGTTTGPDSGGTSVAVTGTGFTGATAVAFGGVAATSFTVVSDTKIQATAPAQPAGAVDVGVLTPAGASAASAGDRYTYTAVPPGPHTAVYRDAGADRVGTGIAVSQQRWTAGSAKAVVLATSLNFPDALAGGPLAAKKGGPLLLTPGTAAQPDPRVLTEIQRVLPSGGAIYVLGGDGAVNPGIVAGLQALHYTVTQFKGADRAGTALLVAEDGMGSPQHVVLATGNGYADALAAGPYAAGPFADAPGSPAAIVLSADTKLDAATAAFLAGKTVATVGAQAGKAWPTAAKAFSGTDRFDTAARVAGEFTGKSAGTQVGIANAIAAGGNPGYPDALTGGAFMAASNGPIVLVDGVDGVLPAESAAVLRARTGNTRADIFGGTGVISPALAAQIVAALDGVAKF